MIIYKYSPETKIECPPYEKRRNKIMVTRGMHATIWQQKYDDNNTHSIQYHERVFLNKRQPKIKSPLLSSIEAVPVLAATQSFAVGV